MGEDQLVEERCAGNQVDIKTGEYIGIYRVLYVLHSLGQVFAHRPRLRNLQGCALSINKSKNNKGKGQSGSMESDWTIRD